MKPLAKCNYTLTVQDLITLNSAAYQEPKKLHCCRCETTLWEDEPTEWLAFTDNDNTDYVCNDCLRDYLIDKNICD